MVKRRMKSLLAEIEGSSDYDCKFKEIIGRFLHALSLGRNDKKWRLVKTTERKVALNDKKESWSK